MTTALPYGRVWAYAGAVLGGAVSIAANVAHSFIQPKGETAASWSPEPGAVVGAVVWPIFLFVAVEILARVAWPTRPFWQLIRWGGLVPVAVVAALVSYRHLSGLLSHYGEEPLVCVLGPLAVDGLMVMATGAIVATAQHPHTSTTAYTIKHTTQQPIKYTTPYTNESTTKQTIESTIEYAPAATEGDQTVPATVPPASDETTPTANAPTAPPSAPGTVTPDPAQERPAAPSPTELATRLTSKPAASPTRSATVPRAAAFTPERRSAEDTTTPRLARPAADSSVTEPDAAQLALPIVPPDLLRRADQVARQYRTEHGNPITAGQLATRLKVTSEQATQALAVLGLAPDNPNRPTPAVNGNRPARTTR